jgi:hypothetical protein
MPVIKVATGAVIADGTVTATVGSASTVYKVSATGATSIVSGSAPGFSTSVQYVIKLNYANAPAEQTAGTFLTSTPSVFWYASFRKVSDGSTPITTWLPLNPLTREIMSDAWVQNGANGNVSILKSVSWHLMPTAR